VQASKAPMIKFSNHHKTDVGLLTTLNFMNKTCQTALNLVNKGA